MIRTVKVRLLNEKEQRRLVDKFNHEIVVCIHFDPLLDEELIEKIKEINGVGWVDDGVDFADIYSVAPMEILLESGCEGTWCEHMRYLVSKIVKKIGNVNYIGPSFKSCFD